MMGQAVETEVFKAEERLRQAMLGSDVSALDELLAAELVFTNHLGQVLGKEDDLNAHRSGLVKVTELTPSERHVLLKADVAVVSVRVHLAGSYAGVASEADFRFTRVWALSCGGTWQVIAGHVSVVA
ncbi:MAG: nuclear transport factor 2 family protein [Sedimentisphaerales bacterium]|nr:nuclear transport factor 2 family protein [Sedimentisphaerales bacterium]